MGPRKVLLITDAGITETGLAERVPEALADSDHEIVATFNEVPQDSGVTVVDAATALGREKEADIIIAIGGGSVLDTAKGVALLLALGESLYDWEGVGVIASPITPLVAIPTTAGTGSEVTQFAVIKDHEAGSKLEFNSMFLCPTVAVLDPELTLSLPPKMTAATGMDALTHAMECVMSQGTEPLSEALSFFAIKEIFENLETAVKQGDDLVARGRMLIAAMVAGLAFSNAGCGIVHGMAHACGGSYGVPHGVGNSICLPYGMEYNMGEVPERVASIAPYAGVDTTVLSTAEAALAAIEKVRDLAARCGLPARLRDVGVPEEGLDALSEQAALDGVVFWNPREATAEDALELFKKAF
jgi:alcohol dehydrogenase